MERSPVQGKDLPTVAAKEFVRSYWDAKPCGTGEVRGFEGTLASFQAIEERRYRLEPFIKTFARFEEQRGVRVLEVGCGVGTDLLQFARAGAEVYAVDYSPRSVDLARRQLALYGLEGDIQAGDAEELPFEDNSFDLVYSWGVIHHTPDTARAAREIVRVLRPGGAARVMIYHRRSLVALQTWLVHGLLSGRPFQSLAAVLAHHHESSGTKAFTEEEARHLFRDLQQLRVRTIVTPYDVRVSKGHFAPSWVRSLLPRGLGFFLLLEGRKVLPSDVAA